MAGPSAHRLDNGLTLLVDRTASPLAAVVVAVGVGSLYEARGRKGVTHLLEHLLFRVPGFDVDLAVESLGAEVNAYTERASLSIVLQGLPQSAAGLVEVAHRLYANGRYEEADLERERLVVLSELRLAREDPSQRVGDLGLKALFGDSDWGTPIGGRPEDVSALQLADLLEHKARWFTPDNTVVAISGPFPQEAVRRAEELFGGLEGRAPPRPAPTAARGPTPLAERGEVDGPYYAYAAELRPSDPAAAFLTLYAAAFHLASGTKSVLFSLLRDRGISYTYHVDFDVVGDRGFLQVAVESATTLETAREAVRQALRPREPPPHRLTYFRYAWLHTDPADRALLATELWLRGWRPGDLDTDVEAAVARGIGPLPTAAEAEAWIVGG